MPLALLLRWLTRIALVGVAGRLARRYATAGTPRARPDPAGRRAAAARAARTAVEGARIGGRVLAFAAFAAAAATLLAAGVTLTSTSPRWLGAVLLAVAAVCATLAVLEMRVALRLRLAWARRRRAEAADSRGDDLS